MIYKLKITNYNEVFVEQSLFKDSQILSKSGNIYLMNATSDDVINFLDYYSQQSEFFNPLDYLIKFVCCSIDDIVDYVNDILYLSRYDIYFIDFYYTDAQTIDYFTVDWSLMEFNKNTYKSTVRNTLLNPHAKPVTNIIKPLTNLSGLFTCLYKVFEQNGTCCGFDKFNGELSSWDTSMITDMSYMFCGSKFFNDISKWNTSNVTNMEGMFSMNLISIPGDDQTLTNPYYCGYTHYNNPPYNYKVSTVDKPSTYINKINILDIADWDTSKVTNMRGMFANSYFYKDLSRWNTSNVTNMSFMFSYLAYDGKTADDNAPNARLIGDLSRWNTSNVTDMAFMFTGSKFNSDVSKWNVSNVTDMSCMFKHTKFVGDISAWDVSNVISSYDMFANTTKPSGSDDVDRILSKWNLLDTNSPITNKYTIKEVISKHKNKLTIDSLSKANSPLNNEFTHVGLTDAVRDYLNQESEITEDKLKYKMECNLTKVGSQYKYFGDTILPLMKGDIFVFTITGHLMHASQLHTMDDLLDYSNYSDYYIYGRCEYLYSSTVNDIPVLIFKIKDCSDNTFKNLFFGCTKKIYIEPTTYTADNSNSLNYYSNSYRFNDYITDSFFNSDPFDATKNCEYIGYSLLNLHPNTEANYEYCKKLISLESLEYSDKSQYYNYTIYDSNDNEAINGTCMLKYCNLIGGTRIDTIVVVLLDGNGSYEVANKVFFMNNYADSDSYLYKGIKYNIKDENDTSITISFGDKTTASEKAFLTSDYYNYTIIKDSNEITGICKITNTGRAYYTNILITTASVSEYVNKSLSIPVLVDNAESYNLYSYENNSWKDYGIIKLSLNTDY
jgi:surface protein